MTIARISEDKDAKNTVMIVVLLLLLGLGVSLANTATAPSSSSYPAARQENDPNASPVGYPR